MKKLPVAIQLYSVGSECEKDYVSTLRAIKEMGYDGVEFANLYGKTPEYLRGVLDGLGLKAVSAHVPLDDMIADPDKMMETYKTLGCEYVVVPYVTEERRPGADKFYETLDEIAKIGECANKHGLTLLYHNHDFEFKKIGDEYGLDVMYNTIPKELLQTELDTCWVNVGGEEPAAFVRKYTGRAPVVHLKDFNMSGKLPEHLYALIGIDDDHKDDEPSTFEFRPVGYGMQDIPAILEASCDAGANWIIVEQDNPSMDKTSLECAKLSRDYLRSLGW